MEFTINEILKSEGIPNTFIVELYWMHGDSDGESTTVSKPFQRGKDEWALEEFVLSLQRLNKLEKDDIEDNEDYIKWFDPYEDYGVAEENYKPFVGLDSEIDMSYGDGLAGFYGFHVYYIDENMNKCDVSINI